MGSNPIIRIQASILWKLLLKAKVVEEMIIRPEGYNLQVLRSFKCEPLDLD